MFTDGILFSHDSLSLFFFLGGGGGGDVGAGAYPRFFFGGDTPLKKGVTPINQIVLQNTWNYIRELYATCICF